MSAFNVIMQGVELDSDDNSNKGCRGIDSSGNLRLLRKTNLKKYLAMLPNSYPIFYDKPKNTWQISIDILDR
jgi:hypothetical protein